jgi:signal peptide peptidase SppA
MRYARILAEFLTMPWALEPRQLATMAAILARRELGDRQIPRSMDDEDYGVISAARQQRTQVNTMLGGGIAVVPIYGVIMQRADLFSQMSGATSTESISQQLNAAIEDDTCASILLDIDSPGGGVFGIAELADEIYAARAKKSVVAIANSLAASAAYWLGAQASEFYATPSGLAGSIGVYTAHEDFSKALDEAGVKTTLISAGKFKTEGNPYMPIDEDAKAFLQTQIDSYYKAFTSDVARGRAAPVATVRDGMGQGRTLLAADAKAAGMVDGIATYAQVVKSMQRRSSAGAASRAAARAREIDMLSS